MELEEKIKKQGLKIGQDLQNKYELSDLYYIDDMLKNVSKRPHAVQADRYVVTD